MVHDFDAFPELTNSQLDFYYFESPHKQITEDFSAKVVRVIDGDTVQLLWGERDFEFPLRMLDINAPELSEGGQEARDFLKDRLEGKTVDIVINENNRVGRFGRILGEIMEGGINMGDIMLQLGLAKKFDDKPFDINRELNIKKWL